MKKKIILCLTLLMCLLIGCGSSANSQSENAPVEKVYLEANEIDNAYASPDDYRGKYVKLYGQVFGEPQKNEDSVYFQMYADAENYEKNTVVILYGVQDIKSGDYVSVDGIISGTYEYKNMMGATMSALQIESRSVEESNYIDCCSPTIKSVELNTTIDQKGYSVTLEKVEYADTETRLYFIINNNGADNFSLYEFNMKLVQNETQYENDYNYNADYPKLQTDLMPGTKSSGIVVFPALDPDAGAKLYCEGSCDNWRTDLEDYVFEF